MTVAIILKGSNKTFQSLLIRGVVGGGDFTFGTETNFGTTSLKHTLPNYNPTLPSLVFPVFQLFAAKTPQRPSGPPPQGRRKTSPLSSLLPSSDFQFLLLVKRFHPFPLHFLPFPFFHNWLSISLGCTFTRGVLGPNLPSHRDPGWCNPSLRSCGAQMDPSTGSPGSIPAGWA